jgi:CO/xanthine dehydrogenase FAD-binding subunit
MEVVRVHGAFPIVGVAVMLHLDADKRIDLSKLAMCGIEDIPYKPSWLDEMLIGEAPNDDLFHSVGARISTEIQATSDRNVDAEYRRSIAGVFAKRALNLAYERTILH